jgi:16S rRNA (cytosine1402-N4)-methyltransferase
MKKVNLKNATVSMSKSTTGHETVLLKETVDGLNLKAGDMVFDGTLGGGGHSAYVAETFGGDVKIIATDRDSEAIARAKARLEALKANFSLNLSDYRHIDKVLAEQKIDQVQGIILDLGLSSNQLDDSGRGFTFKNNEPLYMTFSAPADKPDITAEIIVNKWAEETLADIIFGFGDERYAKRIAKKIVEEREVKEIKTTNDLVEIIRQAVPAMYRKPARPSGAGGGKIHFATKTFQAIRMAVNDELGALKEGLEKGFERLKVGGRMSIISFHSGEDRIVKNHFRDLVKEKRAKLINKKPIIAGEEEVKRNPRSRSAKLRIIEKIN